MPGDTIRCPNCRAEIAVTQAVSQQIREQLRGELDGIRRQQETILAEKQKQLADQQAALDRTARTLNEEIEHKLAAERTRIGAEALRKAQSDLALQMQDLQSRLADKEQKLTEAQRLELDLRRQQRELESKQQALELEVARRIDAERAHIREEALKLASEENRLRLFEKEKVIGDLQKRIEALQQKAVQVSQQLQGEALELGLEAELRSRFPADEIEPVATGVRGADLLQHVRNGMGQPCGTIIWETKRTRNWSPSWLPKLKDDQRACKAEFAILVSAVLPADVQNFAFDDGVWISDFTCAPGLAAALRQGLIALANARHAESGKKEKMEVLYNYLAGTEFRQRIEAVVEAFVSMKADLDAEKRAMARQWAKREKQIEQVIASTAMLYGEVQGIVGQAALPTLKLLELGQGGELDLGGVSTQQPED